VLVPAITPLTGLVEVPAPRAGVFRGFVNDRFLAALAALSLLDRHANGVRGGESLIPAGDRHSLRLAHSACRTPSDGARPRRPQTTRPTGGDLMHRRFQQIPRF
jgi:hypothetical protein